MQAGTVQSKGNKMNVKEVVDKILDAKALHFRDHFRSGDLDQCFVPDINMMIRADGSLSRITNVTYDPDSQSIIIE